LPKSIPRLFLPPFFLKGLRQFLKWRRWSKHHR